MGSNDSRHSWRFFRAGGFDQVRLASGADLMHLDQLDQKLWVALSCPTRGLEFDSKTLDLIDTDHDGRIRVPEILAAVKWACSLLKDPGSLLKCSGEIPLDAINDSTPEGQQLLASARQTLLNLGRGDATFISIDDTTDTTRIFAQTHFNGDGIIPAESADDPAVQSIIKDIIACLGAETDRSGKPGVNRAKVDQFFAEARACSDWFAQAEGNSTLLPLGDATAAAAAALKTVKPKIDDYFARCRLAAFDPRAQGALNRQESEYLTIAAKDMTITATEITGFPLARIEAGKPLPLAGAVNPAWVAPLAAFRATVVKPLLGDRDVLSEGDWAAITAKLAPFDAWSAAKPAAAVEKLGLKRVREILATKAQDGISALIAKDKALEPQATAIAAVDKLVRYHRDLSKLLNNFVAFRDFYGRKDKAVFQAGTLYLDQRSCDLCVRVDDMAKHGTMAHLSYAYLAYCDCMRKSTGEKMTIVAAFTGGDSDNLMVGRNGIFYDRKGLDWDATIVKVVENPISIRQAFWSPYKRLLRWIEDQVAKRAAAADADAANRLTSGAQIAQQSATTGKAPEQKMKLDIGVVAALGVAVGGITAAMGMLLQAFFGLGIWMPIGLVAMILLISGPSMIIAWLKLRQRNLGPILDANGWAVNARARINLPFGASLTGVAVLPPGSSRDLHDPFAESKAGRYKIIGILFLVFLAWDIWYFGALEVCTCTRGLLPKSSFVQRREAAQCAPAEQLAKERAATTVQSPTTAPDR